MSLIVNSIMESIAFIILLSYIRVTIQEQECPISQISFDGKKCIDAETPSSIAKSYFDAESDCKEKAESAGIPNNRTFLVSISSAIENANLISK